MNIKKYRIILTLITGFFLASLIGCSEDVSAGKFVAISNNGAIVYSDDGIQWHNTNKNSASLNSVCYGNGKFVAVGNYGDTVCSSDGNKWIDGILPTLSGDGTYGWESVCYGNGKFVAAAYNTNNNQAVSYSTDGINWSDLTKLENGSWVSICYGDGKFVVVANGAIAYSADAINWKSVVMVGMGGYQWQSVCYGKGKFVSIAALVSGDISNKAAYYSTDGIKWTETESLKNIKKWSSVCYGNGKFVAVALSADGGGSSTDDTVAYSTDGIHWDEAYLPRTGYWRGVCYGDGKFVAVGNDVIGIAAYSYDGIKWHKIEGMPSSMWQSVTYGLDNDIFGFL